MLNLKQLEKLIPVQKNVKDTILLRAFGLAKVPLLFLTSPKVIEVTDSSCRILMPFRKIVKNHWGSMYFGAMAIGADTCVGLLAVDKIRRSEEKVNFIFKSFHAEFLKRAMGDTIFICNEGEKINRMMEKVLDQEDRVSEVIHAVATVDSEEVARFQLELSLKRELR